MATGDAVRKTFDIALDISRSISNREFTVVEGDTGNTLVITLTDDGEPVDLGDCRVMAVFSKSDGETVSQDSGTSGNGVTIGGTDSNEITIDLFSSSFAPGMVECEIEVYSGTDNKTLVTSAKFNFKCRRSILNGDTVAAVPQYPLLVSLLTSVQSLEAAAGELIASAAAALRDIEAVTGNEADRIAAETARAAAEAARASAEETRLSLEAELEQCASSAGTLIAELEDAVATLPDVATTAGLIKGTGTGVAAAVAGTDYLAPPARLTALPANGAALADNTEYRVADAVGTYAFIWPQGPFEAWVRFTLGATFAVSFPSGTKYLGEAPELEAGSTYEMSVKDGTVAAAEAVSE